MENISNSFFSNFVFSTKIQTKKSKIYIDHKKGCNCPKCIQKWKDSDPYYGRIETNEVSLPEGDSILFIDKDRMETSKIDV